MVYESRDGTSFQVMDNHVINYTPPEKFMQTPAWKPWWGKRYAHVTVGALSCDPSGVGTVPYSGKFSLGSYFCDFADYIRSRENKNRNNLFQQQFKGRLI